MDRPEAGQEPSGSGQPGSGQPGSAQPGSAQPGSAQPGSAQPDFGQYEALSSRDAFFGRVIRVRVDEVRMPDGKVAERDVIVHPGAVGVVALDGEAGAERVLLLRQYRHPTRSHLLELPAGILDVAGEPASAAAARELAEEAQLQAARWDVLLDIWTSPGASNEAVRLFLARGVSTAPDTGFTLEDEELDLQPHWVPLEEAVRRVLAGDITNSLCVAGLLAAAVARSTGWSGLRACSAPWPARPDHAG